MQEVGAGKIDLNGLVSGARDVLRANDLGTSTKPAPNLYPHQWNWDSCFIAIGISHYDTERAAQELRSLLRGQWRNGFVPQIVFNPKESGYFPGPDVWQSERSPDAPPDVSTSGITQPPVLATAALSIWKNATHKDLARSFLQEVYPKVLNYHRFLYRERDPDGSGLVVVVHPWESGLDNSPPYLDAGQRVHMAYKPHYERLDLLHVDAKNRPSNKDYDLFVYLLEQMRAVDWDQKRYLESAPLQLEDVLFNSILCRANADLRQIAEVVGEDSREIQDWNSKTVAAINSKLWDEDEGTYYYFDRVAGRLLKDSVIGNLLPVFGQIVPPGRMGRIQERLLDHKKFWPDGGYPVPTTAMDSSWFNPENYWLGPAWVNTNWMLIQGLRDYGLFQEAESLKQTTLKLVGRSGYREYFNPRTGEGYGTDSFGWTAALTIDLAREAGMQGNEEPGGQGAGRRR